jgi:hypothetical protein
MRWQKGQERQEGKKGDEMFFGVVELIFAML